MNPMLFNFGLMLLWGSLALFILVIGPLFAPDMVPGQGRGQTIGFAAAMLAAWNFIRYWSARSARRSRQMEAATYSKLRNPKPASNEPKPVLHPEFQFDDQSQPQPPKTGSHE